MLVAPSVPDGRGAEDRLGSVGGISISHELGDGVRLTDPPVHWTESSSTAAPIVIQHGVGAARVDGLRRVMDVGLRVSYYETESGESAVRIANILAGEPAHVIRTDPEGRHYRVEYEFAPKAPVYRRDIEITAFVHAIGVRGTRLMAHGCGAVLPGGTGAICLGHSGAGKSTAYRMMDGVSGVRVLNDDRLVLERRTGSFQLWSTPWPGTAGVARAGDAQLGIIALIGRGARREARPLGGRAALSRILSTMALPIWSPAHMGAALGAVEDLLERIPVIELRYPLAEATPAWMIDTLQEAAL